MKNQGTGLAQQTTAEFVIREARIDDVPAIAALAADFAQYLRGLGDLGDFRLDAQALMRDGFGDDPAFGGLVAELSGRVVGYLLHHGGYDTDAACRVMFVIDLFVSSSVRRAGIGAALMQRACSIAQQNGAKALVWTVYEPNMIARRFYEDIGARYA